MIVENHGGAIRAESDPPSTSSGNGLRQAQGTAFDKLRERPSTSSGNGLRQAQGTAFDKLRERPSVAELVEANLTEDV